MSSALLSSTMEVEEHRLSAQHSAWLGQTVISTTGCPPFLGGRRNDYVLNDIPPPVQLGLERMVGVLKPQPTNEWGLSKESGLFLVLEKVLDRKGGKDSNGGLQSPSPRNLILLTPLGR